MPPPVIVVPFRADSAKSRLPEPFRAELAAAMLADVLAACGEVGETIVATAPIGLGAAVSAALSTIPARPVLIVNADLPAAAPDDLRAVLRAVPSGGLALVPARDGTTNALALSTPDLFRPLYGAGSCARFRALAESRALELPNLAEDVDTLEDLQRLRARVGPRTRAALREVGWVRLVRAGVPALGVPSPQTTP